MISSLLFLLLSSMILPPAQAPVDTAFYSVSYVDVMPSSRGTAVTAFKQYRDTSRRDEGSVRCELFEQIGRPGHLAIVETWGSPKAFDTHAMAVHTKEFLSKIDQIRLSDFDQRPYKTLTVGPAPAVTNDRAIYVITHVDIGGPQGDPAGLLRRLAEASRKEDGSLRFDVMQHMMRANHFTVIEAWQSQKALDSHVAAAHTKQYRDGLHPISGGPLDERLYKAVE